MGAFIIMLLALLLACLSYANSAFKQAFEIILFTWSMLTVVDVFDNHYENKLQYMVMIFSMIFMYFVFSSIIICFIKMQAQIEIHKEMVMNEAWSMCTQSLTFFVLLYPLYKAILQKK